MGRVGGILVLAVILSTGCAKEPQVGASRLPPATTPVTIPAPAGPEPVPFTDRELADELRRPGSGVAATGQGAAARPAATSPSAGPLPEIKETPRGVVVTLPNAYFAFGSFDLDPQARRVIERIAYVLNHARAARRTVVLEGHADAIGTQAYNVALSRRRAETVARELIGQRVQRERVTIEAHGESRPVAPNQNPDGTDNPAGRAKNRRVETVIRN